MTLFQGPGYDWHRGFATNGIRGYPAEPRVSWDDRASIIYWLCWNDHNGCYRDEEAIAEGLEPLTLDEARGLVREAMADQPEITFAN